MIEDISRVDEVLAALKKLETGYVEVGVLSDNESKLLMIATVNEYGVDIRVTNKMRNYLHTQGLHLKASTKYIRIPERSYIRGSFDENRVRLEREMEDLLIDVVELKVSADDFFDLIGVRAVSMIQQYMRDLRHPPNHPYTIWKKGSSNPLIDTGRLIGSIDYQVKYK